jgi:hypothetical protein
MDRNMHIDPDAGERLKHVIDMASIGTVISTLAGWLPSLAALASLIWTAIRIWETDTVQRWRGCK